MENSEKILKHCMKVFQLKEVKKLAYRISTVEMDPLSLRGGHLFIYCLLILHLCIF